MSTTSSRLDAPIDGCRPVDLTPVALDASALESTAPPALRSLKAELAAAGLVPARVTVPCRFDDECSLRLHEEVDRVREYVRAASFLGAGVVVRCEAVADPASVRSAIAACAERARREGLTFEFDGPLDLDSASTLDAPADLDD